MSEAEAPRFDGQLYYQLEAELAGYFPDRCAQPTPCSMVSLTIHGLAEAVARGDVAVEDARVEASKRAEDIDKNCVYGQKSEGGCFGGSRCNYGSMCRM